MIMKSEIWRRSLCEDVHCEGFLKWNCIRDGCQNLLLILNDFYFFVFFVFPIYLKLTITIYEILQKKCIYTIKNLSQLSYIKINKNVKNIVTPLLLIPQNGQTHSHELFECVWPLCGIKFERVNSQNHFDICVKPTWWIYLLQSLQGHSCGRQFFIPDLNESRESEFFRSRGSNSHILGPRKLSDSEP